jgi:hypothetical protein
MVRLTTSFRPERVSHPDDRLRRAAEARKVREDMEALGFSLADVLEELARIGVDKRAG